MNSSMHSVPKKDLILWVEQYVEHMKKHDPERFMNFLEIHRLSKIISKFMESPPFSSASFIEEKFMLNVSAMFPDLPIRARYDFLDLCHSYVQDKYMDDFD